MADTPEGLGAAEQAFTESETNFTTAETAFNESKTAFDADPENEELKATFTERETAFTTATATRDTAKTALAEMKAGAVKGYWPEDWKEKYIEKQVDKAGKPLDEAAKDKMMKRLARYASPQAALDAMINAQNKISAGGLVKVPGKGATPEEIAQYRKEIGVPEDIKGYDLTLANGMVVGQDDRPIVEGFLKTAHANNYSQQQVTEGLNWFYQQQENTIAARHEADATHRAASEEALREEWGPEFKANVNMMSNYLATDFGPGVAELITGARLADGTPLANHPDILRGFVAKARASNPLGALVPGSGTKQHDQLVDEIAALQKQMATPGWAEDKKAQARYLKLVSIRDKIPEK